MTLVEIEERLRQVLSPRVIRFAGKDAIDYVPVPNAKLLLVQLLRDVERARLLGNTK